MTVKILFWNENLRKNVLVDLAGQGVKGRSSMGYIGYVLILLGMASLFSEMKWLLYTQKYIMTSFLSVGFLLSTVEWYHKNIELTYIFGALFLVSISLFLFVMINRKKQSTYIVEVPADGYEITAVDRNSAPTVQLSYFLSYNGKIYGLTKIPPNGRPALLLSVTPQSNQDWLPASFVVDGKATTKTVKYILGRIYGWVILGILLIFPLFIDGYRAGRLPDFYIGCTIMVSLGYACGRTFKDGRGAFCKMLYYISCFFTMAGWLVLLANLIKYLV